MNVPTSIVRNRNGQTKSSGAGVIVLLMMALVFVPIFAIHAAMIWQTTATGQELASLVGSFLPNF